MAMRLDSVVTWRWKPVPGFRSTFAPDTVNILRRMVARNYPHPHRFICVTDDPKGIDPGIEIVPIWKDFANLPSPHGNRQRYPTCYQRLRSYKPDIGEVFGNRFVTLDLDCVITGDLTPLWDRPEEFVIWGDTNPRTRYNSSMYLLTAGTRPQVWTQFDPKRSPRQALAAGNHGSDQAWVSYCLGPGEATWTRKDGVYSFRNEVAPKDGALPADARIVFMHGKPDPWDAQAQRLSWVREAYW